MWIIRLRYTACFSVIYIIIHKYDFVKIFQWKFAKCFMKIKCVKIYKMHNENCIKQIKKEINTINCKNYIDLK